MEFGIPLISILRCLIYAKLFAQHRYSNIHCRLFRIRQVVKYLWVCVWCTRESMRILNHHPVSAFHLPNTRTCWHKIDHNAQYYSILIRFSISLPHLDARNYSLYGLGWHLCVSISITFKLIVSNNHNAIFM